MASLRAPLWSQCNAGYAQRADQDPFAGRKSLI